MNKKPVVTYKDDEYNFIRIGVPAFITPIDHPSEHVSNNRIVRTSKVIGINKNKHGDVVGFTTNNTKYIKEGSI